MKTDIFQSRGHCWVFQICWYIECSTFTASSFRTWNSSTGIPSPPLILFVVMLLKAHLTSHSRMSGSKWASKSPQWRWGSTVPCCGVRGTECNGAGISSFEGGHRYCHYPYHSLDSGRTTGREYSPTHQQKIEFKIYWAWPCPSEQDPDSSPSQSLPSGSFHKTLTEWKPQSQIIKQADHHGAQPCLNHWNYEPCHVGPAKTKGSWWSILTKCGPLEKGMANHFSILALRTSCCCRC